MKIVAGPDKELALFAFAVGVLAGIETAFRTGHLAQYVIERLARNIEEAGFLEGAPRIQIKPREQSIVVKHLLEMRHQPALIDAVAMEAAADLVVNAAFGHARQRMTDHLAEIGVALGHVHPQEE